MGLKKGCLPNNPSGRKRGSPNKENKELRALINSFLCDQWDTIQADFALLPPGQRVKLYIDLLGYSLPRLEAIPVSESELKIENLSDSALEQLTQHIKKQSI